MSKITPPKIIWMNPDLIDKFGILAAWHIEPKDGYTSEYRLVTKPTPQDEQAAREYAAEKHSNFVFCGQYVTDHGKLIAAYLSGILAERDRDKWISVDEQLPDDGEITQGKGEPELLPFVWPVPDGMDVVTHDGIKVNDYCKPDQYCTVPVVIGGHWHMYDMSRLFLRPVPPEMIEAWYCMETGWVTSDEVVKQAWANNQTVASVQFPKPKGI